MSNKLIIRLSNCSPKIRNLFTSPAVPFHIVDFPSVPPSHAILVSPLPTPLPSPSLSLSPSPVHTPSVSSLPPDSSAHTSPFSPRVSFESDVCSDTTETDDDLLSTVSASPPDPPTLSSAFASDNSPISHLGVRHRPMIV